MYQFSLVVYLDEFLTQKMRTAQQEIYELTGSKACLEIWEPHLTIGSGIEVLEEKLPEMKLAIEQVLRQFQPFAVVIRNYSFIDNRSGGSLPGHTPYVISLDVVMNEKLQALAEKIKELTDKETTRYSQPWPYHPHVTLAYKDLSQDGFRKAKELFGGSEFMANTKVDHIALTVKNGRGERKEFRRFVLG